jgi:hypothetical protein
MTIKARVLDSEGNRYVAMDRAIEDAAAMFGGPLVVDDERYTETPTVATRTGPLMRPSTWDVIPETMMQRRRDALLPGLVPPLNEYLAATATKAAALGSLPRLTAKLVPLIFATCRGTVSVIGTLEELTRLVNPGKSRLQRRDRAAAGAALVACKGLRLIERKADGKMHPYDLFTVDYDLSTDADAEVGFTLNPFFARRMEKGGAGYFLVNIDRLLRLDTQRPGVIAAYLNLAGWWHTKGRQNGIFRPEWCRDGRLLKELAREVNSLSPTAMEYSSGNRSNGRGRKAASEDLDTLYHDLEALRDHGLIGTLETRGRGQERRVIVLPDDGYIEACRTATTKRHK